MPSTTPHDPWAMQDDSPYHPRLVAYLEKIRHDSIFCCMLTPQRTIDHIRTEDPKYKDIPKNKLPLAEFARHVERVKKK